VKVAYLVNQYPKVSHSFIRREIQALERQGVEILRVAVRGWDDELADPEDFREREHTQYILRDGAWRLLPAVLRMALASPARFLAAARAALGMARCSYRQWSYYFVYLAEACRLVPWLRAFGAQHLHAHFGTNPAEVAMLASLLCGVPYSFTVHGIAELDRPEFIALAEKIRRSAFVVAISSFGRSQLYRWTDPADWSKVHVVHCGLERAFHEVPPIPIPDHPRLVCVARLSGEKGQLLLVRAATLLAREGVPFELVLAGDGELRPEIEAEIARSGLNGRVRITGWISSARVRDEIQDARALVLPSFAEGLPIVVMEAMALRRPVLTTFVAGIPELVLHGQHGWLIPAGDVSALASAMKICLAAPSAELERMGNQARERVLERHDADREAARLAELFSRYGAASHGGSRVSGLLARNHGSRAQ